MLKITQKTLLIVFSLTVIAAILSLISPMSDPATGAAMSFTNSTIHGSLQFNLAVAAIYAIYAVWEAFANMLDGLD